MWKPKVAEGWAPFQKGRWRWYDALGYTWVSDEAVGLAALPLRPLDAQGRSRLGLGPAGAARLQTGRRVLAVRREAGRLGTAGARRSLEPSAAPAAVSQRQHHYASFSPDARVIDPAGFKARPKDPLGVAVFALALPSPAFPASRLEATRPALRVGATRDRAGGAGYGLPDPDAAAAPATAFRRRVVTNPAPDAPPVVQPGPPPMIPVRPAADAVIYPVPVLHRHRGN